MSTSAVTFTALPGVPEVSPGDDLALLTRAALDRAALRLRSGDILVFAQKIVSKSEGRFRSLSTTVPSDRARAVAAACLKDPRLVELVLQESSEVVRVAPNVLITRHRLGWVMANAGIDQSNTGAAPGDAWVLLLPENPDASARRLRECFAAHEEAAPGVIISDSFGRPWRIGTVNVALGVCGLPAIIDLRGNPDRNGRPLLMTQVAVADAVAAGAGLMLGEATEGTPIVHVRGFTSDATWGGGQTLLRPRQEDLFQ